MKSLLQDNNIEMYSTHNEKKIFFCLKIYQNLQNKMYKYLTSISKNVYINKLDNIVNKHNNTYHKTIKMKPIKKFFFYKKFFCTIFYSKLFRRRFPD